MAGSRTSRRQAVRVAENRRPDEMSSRGDVGRRPATAVASPRANLPTEIRTSGGRGQALKVVCHRCLEQVNE